MSSSKIKQIEQQLQEFRRRAQAEDARRRNEQEQLSKTKPPEVPPEPKLNRMDYFAIDILNFYPFRKWREWCSSDPYRCWIATICFWGTGQILASTIEFGFVYFLSSIIMLFLLNLGSRKEGELSAYSVFNPNCERLLGQFTSEQFERNLGLRGTTED